MLLEIGHPTHIFDLNKLDKSAIKVSWAKKGEKFNALDEETYELSADHMVITDTKNTIALAGIIGGMDSSVTDSTTEVLIESAIRIVIQQQRNTSLIRSVVNQHRSLRTYTSSQQQSMGEELVRTEVKRERQPQTSRSPNQQQHAPGRHLCNTCKRSRRDHASGSNEVRLAGTLRST